MCSRTVSDTANRLLKRTDSKGSSSAAEKNPLPYSFSQRLQIGNLRQIRKQGKGRSPKRKGNRRCPFLFAPAAGAATSRRPQTATPPLRFSEKLPARKGRTRLRQFAHPGFPVQKRSRLVRANTPAAVRVPRFSGAEKEPPCQGEHARAVRAPRFSGAEKEPPGKGEHAHAVRVPRSAGAENKSRV